MNVRYVGLLTLLTNSNGNVPPREAATISPEDYLSKYPDVLQLVRNRGPYSRQCRRLSRKVL